MSTLLRRLTIIGTTTFPPHSMGHAPRGLVVSSRSIGPLARSQEICQRPGGYADKDANTREDARTSMHRPRHHRADWSPNCQLSFCSVGAYMENGSFSASQRILVDNQRMSPSSRIPSRNVAVHVPCGLVGFVVLRNTARPDSICPVEE